MRSLAWLAVLAAGCAPTAGAAPLALHPPPVLAPLALSSWVGSPPEERPDPEPPAPAVAPPPPARLDCPGSIALVYHHVDSTGRAPVCDDDGITATHKSFRKVLGHLAREGFHFPDPAEFAADIADGTCERAYAIVVVDDPWNEPRKMGLTGTLARLRREHPASNANVWWALAPRKVASWKAVERSLEGGAVHPVSHSLTHPLNPPLTRRSADEMEREVAQSRRELAEKLPGRDAPFFVYPGGNVTPELAAVVRRHYAGAFGALPGPVDGADPFAIPRVGGGCHDGPGPDNSAAVIRRIRQELERAARGSPEPRTPAGEGAENSPGHGASASPGEQRTNR